MIYEEEIEFAGGHLALDEEGYTRCCGTDYTYKNTWYGPSAHCADCGREVEVE